MTDQEKPQTEQKEDFETKEEPQEEHEHTENCDHDHDHKQENKVDTLEQTQKHMKGERKFKKLMKKQGLKSIDNITRVTLRTTKNFIMYIDNPVIMRSGTNNRSFVIYGEPKFLDFKQNLANEEAKKFTQEDENKPEEKMDDIKKEDEPEEDDENVEQGDIKDEDIDNLLSYANCTRAQAIKTLKKTNGDIVEAITLLT